MNMSRRGFLGSLFIVAIGAATAKPAALAQILEPVNDAPLVLGVVETAPTVTVASLNALFKEVYGGKISGMIPDFSMFKSN